MVRVFDVAIFFDFGACLFSYSMAVFSFAFLLLFIQNRSKSGSDDLQKEWLQQQEEYDSNALDNRPAVAPSFDEFK